MKEHPIIFGTEMVRAILEGRKTMTRRVIPVSKILAKYPHPETDAEFALKQMALTHCRYGQVGDRLWVRETWWTPPSNWNAKWCSRYLPIDYLHRIAPTKDREAVSYKERVANPEKQTWLSPLFLPRWASRITLDITGVRVERLHEITEGDVWAEGLKKIGAHTEWKYGFAYVKPQEAFQHHWDSLNDRRGFPWASNPWVWVLEFRKFNG